MKEEYYLQVLNEKCNVSDEWVYEYPCYKIKVNNNDKLLDYVESIVGCSYFYDIENEDLYLKVTKSTLEDKLIF